jgi:hypothetical protein
VVARAVRGVPAVLLGMGSTPHKSMVDSVAFFIKRKNIS